MRVVRVRRRVMLLHGWESHGAAEEDGDVSPRPRWKPAVVQGCICKRGRD